MIQRVVWILIAISTLAVFNSCAVYVDPLPFGPPHYHYRDRYDAPPPYYRPRYRYYH